jgi:hypothetical protein
MLPSAAVLSMCRAANGKALTFTGPPYVPVVSDRHGDFTVDRLKYSTPLVNPAG